jgi:hypothetical protein
MLVKLIDGELLLHDAAVLAPFTICKSTAIHDLAGRILVIHDGNDEDIKKLEEAGITVEKILGQPTK